MRCLIFLNGRDPNGLGEKERVFYRNLAASSDTIICADGGLNIAASLNIEPDMVIGDMDSVRPELLRETDERKIMRYPADKDRTDGRLALEFAIKNGCSDIAISCAISGQTDHSLANIQMLASVPEGVSVRITEPDVEIFTLKGPGRRVINGKMGERVSILPLSERITGITLEGLKYPMRGGEFSLGGMNGISNVMTGEEAGVRIEEGIVGVFHYRHLSQ